MSEETAENSTPKSLQVGVLAIIGSFVEHINMTTRAFEALRRSGLLPENTELKISVVRRPDQVSDSMDAMIIPGGETTVLSRFLDINSFVDVLKEWSRRPTKFSWGTCAGLIVMSNEIRNEGRSPVISIGGLDITCVRNGYGRQKESHVVELEVHESKLQDGVEEPDACKCTGVFIRAPLIESVNSTEVTVLCWKRELSEFVGGTRVSDKLSPVAVAQDNKMATTFHPELTEDMRWHKYFILEAFNRKYMLNPAQ